MAKFTGSENVKVKVAVFMFNEYDDKVGGVASRTYVFTCNADEEVTATNALFAKSLVKVFNVAKNVVEEDLAKPAVAFKEYTSATLNATLKVVKETVVTTPPVSVTDTLFEAEVD